MRGTVNSKELMLTGAALALAASLLSGLPPASSGLATAAIFAVSVPVLGALHQRLQSLPARLGAAGLILIALLGVLG